ncbi:MAG: chloride channel protein [Rubellimicrobium sp.]|nr:chloride channel protein [Rubellimicrobium sp.]
MHRLNLVETVIMLETVVQWLVLATATGMIVGSGTSLFLHGLFRSMAATSGITLWQQMAILPVAGLLNGLLLHYGYRVGPRGRDDNFFAAVNIQRGRMPALTLPIKPVAAIITLAGGGSAGKEGPCSHIGASLGALVGRVLHLNDELRVRLVACGVSAGFASVFGTPVAGAIYGVELLAIGRIRHDFLLPAVIAGVVSYQTSLFWGIPYEYYTLPGGTGFGAALFLKLAVLGVLAGLAALVFVEAVHGAGRVTATVRRRCGLWPPLMPLFGGLLIAALILVIPRDYLGLGLPLIDRALAGETMPAAGFLLKILLVAITIGSGFYGGIVTPQFVIGAMLGAGVGSVLGVDPALGAAVGLTAVVAAASNTPVAATLMGVELFGTSVSLAYVAAPAVIAYLVIGHRSIYPRQRMAYAKSSWMRIRPESAVDTEKARLSRGLLRMTYALRRRIGRRRR